MILLVVVVICALASVTGQHRARKLFQGLEQEQERGRLLEVEYGQLQLEMSTWANHSRVEKIATERLRMLTPEAAQRQTAQRVPPRKGDR